ncbi:TH1 protein [Dichotomocladium elegans]|nr:TH1 protein [Dichotomocladium elegans]
MAMDLSSDLHYYTKGLERKDAVLQADIFKTNVAPFLKSGGNPNDAAKLLSESYAGFPSMIKVAAGSAEAIGVDCSNILRDTIKKKLLEKFDPDRVDRAIMGSAEHPADMPWLDSLIHDKHWRESLYELFDKYPRCEFLNFAIMRMAESGYRDEVARLRTSSSYMQVYSLIMENSLSELIKKDDTCIDNDLPDFIRVCCEQEHFYLYAQVLIKRLHDEYEAAPLKRLSKELEKAAISRGYSELVDILKSCAEDIPLDLAAALKAIRNSNQPTPGDVLAIHSMYTSANPPSVQFIRDYDFIMLLLKSLYVPGNNSNIRPDVLEKMIFLISYATTYNDAHPREAQMSEIQRVSIALHELYKELQSNQAGGDFSASVNVILQHMSLPVASMAILLWIEYLSVETPYYETYYRSADVPLPHLLLDEIAYRHPFQRAQVLQVIERCFSHTYENFAPEILSTLQKRWIERLVYLVQLQYTLPVFKMMKKISSSAEHSLTVHFVTLVLESADPPYSCEFVDNIVDILHPISSSIGHVHGFDVMIHKLADYALNAPNAGISDELKERVQYILRQSKYRKTSLSMY